MDICSIFFNMKVFCVFSLESPHGLINIPYSILQRKSSQIIPNLQLCDLFQVIRERVRNSRGKLYIARDHKHTDIKHVTMRSHIRSTA